MKFINQNDIRLFITYPITRASVFVIETVDAALVMCDGAFQKLNAEGIRVDFPTFKYQLLKNMYEFMDRCVRVHEDLFNESHRLVDEKRYQALGIRRQDWDEKLQKPTAENFIIMQYCLAFAKTLHLYLLDCGADQAFAKHFAWQGSQALAKWIIENCIKKCQYACLRRAYSNGYCNLCTFMVSPLPCPRKNEISFQQVGMEEHECNCLRR